LSALQSLAWTRDHLAIAFLVLAVLGGWSVATWLTERLSNEVASHTRATNQKITDRFAQLGHEQIEKLCRWLDEQAPKTKTLEQLERAMGEAREVIGS